MQPKIYAIFLLTLILAIKPVRSQRDVFNLIIKSNSSDVLYGTLDRDHVINIKVVSIINFIVDPIALFLHSTILYLIGFSSKRKNYKNIFFKLVMLLSFTEGLCCFFLMYMATCNLTGRCPIGEWFNIALCTFAQYIIYFCMNMNMLIAFNRFVAVVLYNQYTSLFNTRKSIMYIIMVMAFSALACMPTWVYKKKYYVEIQTFTFVTMPPKETLNFIMWFELCATYVVHTVMIGMYVWAYIFYKKQFEKTGNTSVRKKDVRFLVQAGLSGIPCMLLMTSHHLFPTPIVENLAGDWCVSIAPPIYLWFNQEIRADWVDLIGLNKARRWIDGSTVIQKIVGRRSNMVGDSSHAQDSQNVNRSRGISGCCSENSVAVAPYVVGNAGAEEQGGRSGERSNAI